MHNDDMIIRDGEKKFRIDGELAQEHGVHCVKISNDAAQHKAFAKAIVAVRNMPFVGNHIKELVIDEIRKLKDEIGVDIES